MPSATSHDAAPLSALAEAAMIEVELDGQKLVLVRQGGQIYALAGTCPHAGAPLAEGVLHAGRIICPWHKAAFCARTGEMLEPPALDPLARFEVRVENDRILVTPSTPQAAPPGVADTRLFAIIGAGAAAAMAAQTLRQEGFTGRIVLIDDENRVPYDRTVLSKYFLSGEHGAEKSPLQSQAYYRGHGIERRTARVERVDIADKRITTSHGEVIQFDAALIATGATPKLPPMPGITLRNVFILRTRHDAEAILAQAERSQKAVVYGAGFISMEVAASLRERGLDVTLVAREQTPLDGKLGFQAGQVLRNLHESKGVTFRMGRTVDAMEGDEAVRRVVLDNGDAIETDLVVVGLGVTPAADCLADIYRNKDGGVDVDAHLRIAGEVFAAGDIASFPLFGDGERVRVEHWRVAEQHGRIAALNMLGKAQPYTQVPVFWTIQYMKRVDYIGHASDWDDVVIHGDLKQPQFLIYYIKDGRVLAAAGLDRDRDTAALIQLFGMRRDWTAQALGDSPEATLKAMPE
jgi:NADPH-dependent 2,4-dienoyl-CoA reductase/sulfur reductase-like enzyme/nitrite reductase/ring-hydroxylating ferredoxin subunit